MMTKNLDAQLAELLRKLGLGIDEGLPMLVRWTVMDAYSCIALSLVVCALLAYAFKATNQYIADDDNDMQLFRAMVRLVIIIVAILMLMVIGTSITTIIEPRGYLIYKLLK
jgi:ATP/ADP translocase